MLSLPSAVKIFLCMQPTDMRRSFDGLAAMVRDGMGHDPLGGHLFVFCNRVGDRIKLLYWNRDGYALWYKRLEKGVFRIPSDIGEKGQLHARDFTMMLEGVDFASIRKQRRYELKKNE